jgi:hypothetical protein
MQALARRNHARRKVGGQLAGAGLGGEVALVFVVADLLIGKGVEATSGFVFTGRPEGAQAIAGCFETFNRLWDRVAVQLYRCLGLWRCNDTRQGAVQAGVADLAELAEHLEIRAGLGQHAARLEEQLVEVAVEGHAISFQGLGHGGVPTTFVDAVFLVDVD